MCGSPAAAPCVRCPIEVCIVCHWRVISRCAAIAAAVHPHRPALKRSNLKNSPLYMHAAHGKQRRCDHSSQGYTVQKNSIPALLMRQGKRNCGAESLRSAWSELTMAIATGLMLGWSRCAVCRSAPRPGLSVVQHQQQQQSSSPPSLPVFPVPSLISHTAGQSAGVCGSRSPLMTQGTSLQCVVDQSLGKTKKD